MITIWNDRSMKLYNQFKSNSIPNPTSLYTADILHFKSFNTNFITNIYKLSNLCENRTFDLGSTSMLEKDGRHIIELHCKKQLFEYSCNDV